MVGRGARTEREVPGRQTRPAGPGRHLAAASGSLEDYADFLETVLSALEAPAGLAGFSMGGYAALALARRRPERLAALALVDTRAQPDDEAGRAKRDEAIARCAPEA